MSLTSEWVSFERYREALAGLCGEMSSMYHRAPWLDALVVGFGAQIRAVHTVDAEGKSLALTPFMIKRKGPFCLVGSPLSGMYTEFAGPLFAADLVATVRVAVMESQHRLVSRDGHYVEWGSKGGLKPVDSWGVALERWGYVYTTRPTLLVDLAPGEERVWASFEGRARNMIRKAEKAGVTVRSVKPTEDWISGYYGMLSATFDRQGRSVPHPLSFYRSLIPIAERGEAHCVTAEIEGRMIAGGIFLVDGPRMLYLSGTADAEGMKLAGTSLVQWHAMRDAITAGVTEYDMGGLGVPSIDSFKRSFGGSEIVHHRWIHRSSLFRLLEPVAQWAARKGLIRLGGS